MPSDLDIDLFAFRHDDFKALVEALARVFREPKGPAGTEPIWLPEDNDLTDEQLQKDEQEIRRKLVDARPYLPIVYRKGFVDPLLENLAHLMRSRDRAKASASIAEPILGAVVQHGRGGVLRQPLRQFLAVVSNLYRSFLAPDKRMAARIPLAAPSLPPLVSFFHRSVGAGGRPRGPVVLPSPQAKLICDSEVAVVSLPATYAKAPLTWVPLAHEASGHGVLHADENLLPDLVAGVRSLFGGGPLGPGQSPNAAQALGLLWSYWIDETASDVYGLLNIGPAFALNLAALLVAHRRVAARLAVEPGTDPEIDLDALALGVESITPGGRDLDAHPPDLLRLHVAIGVIQNLEGLAPDRVDAYVAALEAMSAACRSGRTEILIDGLVEVERDRWVRIAVPNEARKIAFKIAADDGRPLPTEESSILESARRVGAFIATTQLGALGNHTIQEVETWDEADERTALVIASELLKHVDYNGPDEDDPVQVASLGDDGQLLAGATLAAFGPCGAQAFDLINRRLARALDRSFESDPLLGLAQLHPMLPADLVVPDDGDVEPTSIALPRTEKAFDTLEAAPETGAAIQPAPAKTTDAVSAPPKSSGRTLRKPRAATLPATTEAPRSDRPRKSSKTK